jgi:serine/threonine-protein kinase RsbT
MPGEKINLSLSAIRDSLKAEILCEEQLLHAEVNDIYASDLMSDVLAYGESGSILLTGLCTKQAVITSFLALFKAIVFIRGKTPTPEMVTFAQEKKLAILLTEEDMFEVCVKLAALMGQLPTDKIPIEQKADKHSTVHEFFIEGSDFANSGMVSTQVKSILQSIGYDTTLIRRVAISTYEAEMNIVMHALRGKVLLSAGDREIIVDIQDEGKGIPDIEKAMQRGFSTATEEQRALGFGSGMGLPNINKNADELKITSEVNVGTHLNFRFNVPLS